MPGIKTIVIRREPIEPIEIRQVDLEVIKIRRGA